MVFDRAVVAVYGSNSARVCTGRSGRRVVDVDVAVGAVQCD